MLGVLLHFINGWIFSFLYVSAFNSWGAAKVWLGISAGFVHAAFVLTTGLPILPALHPRMANEQFGPTVVRQLEPPGFLGLHYGVRTPISIMGAHIIFGLILALFYKVP